MDLYNIELYKLKYSIICNIEILKFLKVFLIVYLIFTLKLITKKDWQLLKVANPDIF